MEGKQYEFCPEKVDKYFDYESYEAKDIGDGQIAHDYVDLTLKRNWSLPDSRLTFKKKDKFITMRFSSQYPLGVVCWESKENAVFLTVDSADDFGPFYEITIINSSDA